MLILILKSSACLAIFMVFYKLFLEKESIHHFKRFYLLGALLVSIGIPFITFTHYVEAAPNNLSIVESSQELILEPNTFLDYLPNALLSIYLLGVVIFSIRFSMNLKEVFNKIKNNPKCKYHIFTNVLLQEAIAPHTFFSYIFLNKSKFENQQIPKEVLLHEQTHASQKHSIDILLLEIFQIVFWFNPPIYLVKHAVKLNHEFLADKNVLSQGVSTPDYQQTLLAYSSHALKPQLANAINYSLIKKRFTIMKTQTSKQAIWLRSLILLPLLAILIYSFSTKTIVEQEHSGSNISATSDIQQKATPEQLAEYNALVKKYSAQPVNKRIIKLKELKRLEYLYSIMSDSQRKSVEDLPNYPPPPPPKAPDATDAPKVKEVKLPPPPPPTPANATDEQKKRYKKVIQEYKEKHGNGKDIPPSPPPLNMEKLAKENAVFYYESKKISAKKAIEIYNANKDLNVQVRDQESKQPVVKISKEPIRLRKEH